MQRTTWVSAITRTPTPCLVPSQPPSKPSFQVLPLFPVELVGVVIDHVENLVRLGGLGKVIVGAVAEAGPAVGVRRLRAVHHDREKAAVLFAYFQRELAAFDP